MKKTLFVVGNPPLIPSPWPAADFQRTDSAADFQFNLLRILGRRLTSSLNSFFEMIIPRRQQKYLDLDVRVLSIRSSLSRVDSELLLWFSILSENNFHGEISFLKNVI